MAASDVNKRVFTDTTGQALVSAVQALQPGVVTTSQAGLYAPADYISEGKIIPATSSKNGLLTAADKALLDNPPNILTKATTITRTAAYHNSIYRGKNLGTSFTSAQSSAIQAGTFDDMFLGDYWVINSVTYIIAGFDTHYRTGDTDLNKHHIAVIPAGNMGSSVWNETNDTSTGYVGSKIRENIKASGGAQATVIAAFGDSHVLSYRAIYPTTYSDGKATGWAWTDARVELMNETMVYGHQVWTGGGNGNGYEDGADKQQLPLFAVRPDAVNIRAGWWLRSVYSAAHACLVANNGDANAYGASNSFGVRPLSLIA